MFSSVTFHYAYRHPPILWYNIRLHTSIEYSQQRVSYVNTSIFPYFCTIISKPAALPPFTFFSAPIIPSLTTLLTTLSFPSFLDPFYPSSNLSVIFPSSLLTHRVSQRRNSQTFPLSNLFYSLPKFFLILYKIHSLPVLSYHPFNHSYHSPIFLQIFLALCPPPFQETFLLSFNYSSNSLTLPFTLFSSPSF